jgi:hypothetical protein
LLIKHGQLLWNTLYEPKFRLQKYVEYDKTRFSVIPAHMKRAKNFNQLRYFVVSRHTPNFEATFAHYTWRKSSVGAIQKIGNLRRFRFGAANASLSIAVGEKQYIEF